MINNYEYEQDLINQGYKYICGIDEAGRGPLVGPVVACAVILPLNYQLEGLTDSKKLSKKKREAFYEIIIKDAISYGVSIISNRVIDEVNILEATKLAMVEAISKLSVKPDYILVDAVKLDIINSKSIIKGDQLSLSIAAASVIAKVARDKIMLDLHHQYPQYGYDTNQGYPTKSHLDKIEQFGVTKHYRRSYKPVQRIIDKTS